MYGACRIPFLARGSSGSNTLFLPQHHPQLRLTRLGNYRLSQPPEVPGWSHDEKGADILPAGGQYLVAPRPLLVVKDSVVCQIFRRANDGRLSPLAIITYSGATFLLWFFKPLGTGTPTVLDTAFSMGGIRVRGGELAGVLWRDTPGFFLAKPLVYTLDQFPPTRLT
jgi:hypothetical protein